MERRAHQEACEAKHGQAACIQSANIRQRLEHFAVVYAKVWCSQRTHC